MKLRQRTPGAHPLLQVAHTRRTKFLHTPGAHLLTGNARENKPNGKRTYEVIQNFADPPKMAKFGFFVTPGTLKIGFSYPKT